MTVCSRCGRHIKSQRLLCARCLARAQAIIAANKARHCAGGSSSFFEPSEADIAAGTAAIRAGWSDSEYYARAGVHVPSADTPVISRGISPRVDRRRFEAGS
jgi:hypothetical protein